VNIGLFGGTFDPPHAGHLIVAQDAALALGLDRILFIPAAQPPHKLEMPVTAALVRLRMLELAIGDDSRFGIERAELERSGPSFTVDTLRAMHEAAADADLTLLMGADQYADFPTWREPEEIRRRARLAVLMREGTTGAAAVPGASWRPAVSQMADGAVSVAVTRVDISSTAIRWRVAEGLPIRYLVPPAVERFINEHRLYSRNGSSVAGYNPEHPE
jgi:nicotinate-nucleotide adenylyltransferase